jgi:hypothetical protein
MRTFGRLSPAQMTAIAVTPRSRVIARLGAADKARRELASEPDTRFCADGMHVTIISEDAERGQHSDVSPPIPYQAALAPRGGLDAHCKSFRKRLEGGCSAHSGYRPIVLKNSTAFPRGANQWRGCAT